MDTVTYSSTCKLPPFSSDFPPLADSLCVSGLLAVYHKETDFVYQKAAGGKSEKCC